MRYLLAPVGSEGDIPFVAMGIDIKKSMTDNPKVTKGITAKTTKTTMNMMGSFLDEQISGLLRYEPGCDRIIGAGLLCTGSSIAEKLGIPYRHVIYCPQLFPSAQHPPYTVRTQNYSGFTNKLLWKITNAFMYGLLEPFINRRRKKLGLNRMKFSDSYMTKNVIVAMDQALASIPSDVNATYFDTAYWPLDSSESINDDLASFIEQGDAPVYIGFGSMTDKNPDKTAKIIIEVVEELGFRAIIASGWAGMKHTKHSPSVFTCSHVPHQLVLPRMKAIIHHGGAGSTWSSARAGVPQAAIPHMLDQYFWNERIFTLGIGPRGMSRSKLNRQNFKELLENLVTGNSYQVNAKSLSQVIKARNGTQEALNLFN